MEHTQNLSTRGDFILRSFRQLELLVRRRKYIFIFEAATDPKIQPMTITRFHIAARKWEHAKVLAKLMMNIDYTYFEPCNVYLANKDDFSNPNISFKGAVKSAHQVALQKRLIGV